MLLHATCVAVTNAAILLTGAAGSGKSDVALRLIDAGATLIADDQTLLTREGDTLIAAAPASIAGLMEVRHVGLLRLPFMASAPVALLVDLAPMDEKLERLPEPDLITLLDIQVRRLRLPAFAASTAAKIKAAVMYPMAE